MTELRRMLVPVHPAPLLGHSHTSLQLAPWEICRATESSGKHVPGISDPRRPRGMRRKRVEGWDGRPWCADPRSSWHHGGLTCWDSSVGLWTGASLILSMARGQPMPLLLFLTQDTLLLGWPHPPLPGLAEKRDLLIYLAVQQVFLEDLLRARSSEYKGYIAGNKTDKSPGHNEADVLVVAD